MKTKKVKVKRIPKTLRVSQTIWRLAAVESKKAGISLNKFVTQSLEARLMKRAKVSRLAQRSRK